MPTAGDTLQDAVPTRFVLEEIFVAHDLKLVVATWKPVWVTRKDAG